MSNVLQAGAIAAPVRYKKPGRKKVRGALEFCNGNMRWLLGYCDDCGGKVTATREEMDMLKLNVQKQRKSPMYKLLVALLRRYES